MKQFVFVLIYLNTSESIYSMNTLALREFGFGWWKPIDIYLEPWPRVMNTSVRWHRISHKTKMCCQSLRLTYWWPPSFLSKKREKKIHTCTIYIDRDGFGSISGFWHLYAIEWQCQFLIIKTSLLKRGGQSMSMCDSKVAGSSNVKRAQFVYDIVKVHQCGHDSDICML